MNGSFEADGDIMNGGGTPTGWTGFVQTYTYLDVGGYTYWTMGCPVGPPPGHPDHSPVRHTVLINRVPIDPED